MTDRKATEGPFEFRRRKVPCKSYCNRYCASRCELGGVVTYQEDRFRDAFYGDEVGVIDRADSLRRICEKARRDYPEDDLVCVIAEDVYWLVCAYEEALGRV